MTSQEMTTALKRGAALLHADGTTSTRRVLDVVTAEGYVPYEFYDWTLRPHAITERYGYQNLLMVPHEKVADMVGSG